MEEYVDAKLMKKVDGYISYASGLGTKEYVKERFNRKVFNT
jgi:hypothetical protein